MYTSRSAPQRPGFTLVELLVVIGIIALLVGILLPTLSQARVSGQQVVCASNLRQLGVGISLYADDNKEWFPQSSHDHLHGIIPAWTQAGVPLELNSWIHTMREYIANVDEVRVCPAHQSADKLLETTQTAVLPDGETVELGLGTAYLFNYYLITEFQQQPSGSLVPVTVADWRRRIALENPVDTIVLMEASEVDVAKLNETNEDFDHTDADRWFTSSNEANWAQILSEVSPDRHVTNRSERNDAGRANYLFADTHVAPIEAAAIRRQVFDRFDFSMPPNDRVSAFFP
ncbi:MAG: type II secretion system protein [Planctomycetota bacterium]